MISGCLSCAAGKPIGGEQNTKETGNTNHGQQNTAAVSQEAHAVHLLTQKRVELFLYIRHGILTGFI